MVALIDSTAGNNTPPVPVIRQLSFAEITGAMSEKGYCYLRAALYHKKDDGYGLVNTIDTVLLVKSMDVTKVIIQERE